MTIRDDFVAAGVKIFQPYDGLRVEATEVAREVLARHGKSFDGRFVEPGAQVALDFDGNEWFEVNL